MNIMTSLATMETNLKKTAGKAGLQIKKNSPAILFTLGTVSFVGTIIFASKAATKSGAIITKHKEAIAEIDEAIRLEKENPMEEDYAEIGGPREKLITVAKTSVEFIKLYWPTAAAGTFTVACYLGAYKILNARYIGAVAAFNAVSEAFKQYRARVVEEEGEDADRHYYYGTERLTETTTQVGEDGKKTKVKTQTDVVDPAKLPAKSFDRIFDRSNGNWDVNPTFNLMFLRGQQAVCNNILHTRGHIFLNEVYEYLGFKPVPEGQVVGWIDDGNGDGFVSFGLPEGSNYIPVFIREDPQAILLSFNHDGIVYDKI